MGTIADKYPSDVWGRGDEIYAFLARYAPTADLNIAGVSVKELVDFLFNLVPDWQTEEIKAAGMNIWGIDDDQPGAIGTGLREAEDAIKMILTDVDNSGIWSGDAHDAFHANLNGYASTLDSARRATHEVGKALVEFTAAAESGVADAISGVVGAVGSWILSAAGAAAGAIGIFEAAGAVEVLLPALVLFAGALAVAWLGIYFPKMYNALQALNHLRSKGHAPGSPA
jgi:hypothetical protein